jgi:hypothetical protein
MLSQSLSRPQNPATLPPHSRLSPLSNLWRPTCQRTQPRTTGPGYLPLTRPGRRCSILPGWPSVSPGWRYLLALSWRGATVVVSISHHQRLHQRLALPGCRCQNLTQMAQNCWSPRRYGPQCGVSNVSCRKMRHALLTLTRQSQPQPEQVDSRPFASNMRPIRGKSGCG